MALIDGLVSYWKLDETSGTTATDAHGSNDGTNNGAALGTAGKIGNAYDFETGDNDNVQIANESNFDFTTGMSISCWIKLEAENSYFSPARIVSKAGSWELVYPIGATNTWGFTYIDGAGVLNLRSATTTGVWYHVVATYDTTNGGALYIDTNVATTADTGDLVPNDVAVWFGAYSPSPTGGYELDGLLDEVGIWNRALTSDEVSELYNGGSGLAYPLVAAGTNMQINVDDTLKEVAAAYVNVDDAWKEVSKAYVNVDDNWKEVF